MRLRSSPYSPFGRKVKIAAAVIGILDKITIEQTDPLDGETGLWQENPLGQIPLLVTDTGEAIYDSRVILQYLDEVSAGQLVPLGVGRIAALRREALADGMMAASVLRRYEASFHAPEQVSQRWIDHQAGKVARGLAVLEADPPAGSIDIGSIAAACALGYLDLRFEGFWRADHPRLVAFLDDFRARVPAFDATNPEA